jgi:hypothetical protein
MTELTTEEWSELNDKLSGELGQAEARVRASSMTAVRFGVATVGVLVATAVLAIIIRPTQEQAMYFMPAGAAFAVLGWLFLRATRLKGIAEHDVERIQRDIRQWKKRKPGRVFTRKQEPGAQATG